MYTYLLKATFVVNDETHLDENYFCVCFCIILFEMYYSSVEALVALVFECRDSHFASPKRTALYLKSYCFIIPRFRTSNRL